MDPAVCHTQDAISWKNLPVYRLGKYNSSNEADLQEISKIAKDWACNDLCKIH